jgi:AraC-like DNA-binding protein
VDEVARRAWYRVRPVATVLATSSLAILEVCRRDGLDTEEMLAAVGLGPEDVTEPGARIPIATATALWRLARERASDAAIGLRAVEAARFGSYRVIDYLSASAATVGGAFGHLARCFPLINSSVALSIARRPEGVWLRLIPAAPLVSTYVEYTLAAIFRRVRSALGCRFHPERVQLAFPTAPSVRELQLAFDSEIELGAGASGLLFSQRAWDQHNPARDEGLERTLAGHARRLVMELGEPTELVLLRATIREQLRVGDPSLPAVARQLVTSTRSLQRMLAGHQLRYAKILEQTRIAAAEEYLRDPRCALSEIAGLVGFSHQSSFTRAFRNATGRSPSEYRRRLRADQLSFLPSRALSKP